MNKKQKKFVLLFLFATILIGAILMAYPLFSSWYSNLVSSEVHSEFAEAVETVDTSEIDLERSKAVKYNIGLYEQTFDPLDPENNGYFDIIDLTQSGIMGYIDIPSINVSLPIYHGTSDRVLKAGAGHMPNTSFPIGGETTHAVITAHSGMASNPMFSDIVLLEEGDTFQIEILGEILTYEIQNIEDGDHSDCSEACDIKIVSPQNIEHISITEGADYCSLVTCYPFGVNTHRYLVRGHRIPTPEVAETVPDDVPSEEVPDKQSVWNQQYMRSVKIGLVIAAVCITGTVGYILYTRLIHPRKKGRFE